MKSISWSSAMVVIILVMSVADDLSGFSDRISSTQRWVHDFFVMGIAVITTMFIRGSNGPDGIRYCCRVHANAIERRYRRLRRIAEGAVQAESKRDWKPLNAHEGRKYQRTIHDAYGNGSVQADVYAVLEAFDVRCPGRQHAIKKLLCAGIRGKGNALADLREAAAALSRAIDLEERRSRPADGLGSQIVVETSPAPVVVSPDKVHYSSDMGKTAMCKAKKTETKSILTTNLLAFVTCDDCLLQTKP